MDSMIGYARRWRLIFQRISSILLSVLCTVSVAITHADNRIVIRTPNTFVRAGNDIEAQYADKKVAVIADEMHEANVCYRDCRRRWA